MHHYELYRSQNQCINGLGWSVESVYSVEPVDGVWMSRDDDLVQITNFSSSLSTGVCHCMTAINIV